MPFSEQLPTGSHDLPDVIQFDACEHPHILGTTHSMNKTLKLFLSYGENHILVALSVFTINIFKMWS
jgi:hypothetical protein